LIVNVNTQCDCHIVEEKTQKLHIKRLFRIINGYTRTIKKSIYKKRKNTEAIFNPNPEVLTKSRS
jgi:hypothetical protein